MTSSEELTRLCFLPATELAARIRRRDLSPVEVVNAYLDRIWVHWPCATGSPAAARPPWNG
jgi:Asp-tRNA(Asn)/Glu-tRNA(Gln) amidotransferase A subunit family amidase